MGRTTLSYFVVPGLKLRKVRFQRVITAIAETFEISEKLMMSKSRQRELVLARNMCMYVMKNYFNMTLKEVGKCFSRDHTTVIHALRMFSIDVDQNEYYELKYLQVKRKLELRKGIELTQ